MNCEAQTTLFRGEGPVVSTVHASGGSPTILGVGDAQLVEIICSAKRRLVFAGPGVSDAVGSAIASQWRTLGKDSVSIILDTNPEVFRLGYGTLEGVCRVQRTAESLGGQIQHQSGLRVGLVVADETILLFSPLPLLVEGADATGVRSNAIRLGCIPSAIEEVISASGTSSTGQGLGETPVTPRRLEHVQEDLHANPPVKFDLARKVRVFNAQFEFVEFEVKGCFLSRRTVRIPSDLLGLAKDERTQKLLHSTFRLIDDESLSGERVYRLKQWIADQYLVSLPGYGNVVLRANKPEFERAVGVLRRYVARFQRQLEQRLQAAMDANRAALVEALLPAVKEKPPKRWHKFLGLLPSEAAVRACLENELKNLFGDAAQALKRMDVTLIFKGVTYESLNDAKFIEVARERLPSLAVLHEEYDAAKAATE